MPNYYAMITNYGGTSDSEGFVSAVADPGSGNDIHTVTITVYAQGQAPEVITLQTDSHGYAQSESLLPTSQTSSLIKVQLSVMAAVTKSERAFGDSHRTQIPANTVGQAFRFARCGGDADLLLGNPGTNVASVTITQAGGSPIVLAVLPKYVQRVSVPVKKTYVRVTSNEDIIVEGVVGNSVNSTLVLPG